jgi:hypothetical protein
VFVSHILSMTSEACVAIISALECSPEKAKKRCFHINDWIPIDTCCATSPLTMQTSCATAVLHKQIRTVLIVCNRLCKLSISTIHGQPVAQHAMLCNMIDLEWAPLVCSRFLSCSKAICPVRVVIIVECVLPHYCSISGKIKNTQNGIVVLCV